jgi:17beta-estradiol 17-dehydrogenase / very-long-chain 3-oxoacyl-CoA reductase
MLVPIVERVFAGFGVILVSVLLLRFSRFVYFYFVQGPAIQSYHHGEEPWALITGASAGIGGALAQEITKYGFNVILLGHKREELEQHASTIKAASPNSQTKIVVADACKASFSEVKEALEAGNILQLNISVLINNVGGLGDVFTEIFKPFHRYTLQELDSVLAINNRFMVYLTSIMLPVLGRSPRSLIINIGSMAESGTPYQTLYSGTKSFVAGFSKALDWELKAEGFNIDVTDIVPGEVRTQGHKPQLRWQIPTSEKFARAVLSKVGPGRGRHFIPYWPHRLLLWMTQNSPESIFRKALIEHMNKMRDRVDGKKGS